MKPSSYVVVMIVMLMMMITYMDFVMAFKEFNVGGRSNGWTVPHNNETDFFDKWASKKRFHVGDTLLFQYKNDSLLIVDKYGYYHCNSSNATNTYTDGNTAVKLEHPGFIYFISGNVDRCLNGLRMVVDVMSHHVVAHSPSPWANPPETIGRAETPGPSQASGPSSATNSGSSHRAMVQLSCFLGFFVPIISMFF